MKKLTITIIDHEDGRMTTDIDGKGFNIIEQIAEIQKVIMNRLSVLRTDYLEKEKYKQLLIDNKILIPKKPIKICPNCKEPWNGYECNHCGFDATESDIY
jgi:hypothetical protein